METGRKTTDLVRQDAKIFTHNILENLSLPILFKKFSINFGTQTRQLHFQRILRYRKILRMVPNHGLQNNTAKGRYNFYCSPPQNFPQVVAHTSDPDIFHL